MKKRYFILDEIRGITLCSMILYHAAWDFVYIFGENWEWYRTDFAYIWQQSICWCFILLSGFCFSLGKKKWKRSLTVLGAGMVISFVTEIFMPQNRVRFGVLTLLGSSMLIVTLLEKFLDIGRNRWCKGEIEISKQGTTSKLCAWVCFALFLLTKNLNAGFLGFADVELVALPKRWYQSGNIGNYMGFTSTDFYSADYFSLFPWFFLFLTGYFIQKCFVKKEWMDGLGELPSLGKVWRFLGKHSLLIYLIHQPIIYGILYILYL